MPANRTWTRGRTCSADVESSEVPVIRDDRGELAEPFPVTFLTSPAPNAGELARRADTVDLPVLPAERAERAAFEARFGVTR
ncbi:hypothetical protein [Nocardia sp. No.11]|uniref:hypothetical protein n=1 Tax=Nocardia sp. No.11 TaxID=3128861 RepID=UPI00319E047F